MTSATRRPGRQLMGVFVVALATSAVLLPQLSRGEEIPNLDEIELDTKVDPNAPIEAEKWLRLWADRLKLPIFTDPQMAGVKIRFLQADIRLTWGVAKQILGFYEVVVEEKSVGGHWIMFARMRRTVAMNLGTTEGTVAPIGSADDIRRRLPPREEVVTALIQITNGAASDIFGTLRQLLPHDINHLANILYVRGPEVIIIVDFASNVQYYLKIIKALDVQAHGQEMRIIQIQFALAADVVKVIQQLLRPAGATGQAPGGVIVGAPGGAALLAPQIIGDDRTNQIFVQAYDYQLAEIDRIIAALDRESPPSKQNLHVYHCRYVEASYLASKLSELLTGQTSPLTGRQKKQAGGAAPTAAGVVNLQSPQPTPGAQPVKQDYNAIATRIVADERQNSLIIQADDKAWKQIEPLLVGGRGVPSLDTPQRVVLIEAQIWEIATPQDTTTIGFELADVENTAQGQFRPELGTSFDLSTLSIDPTSQRISRVPSIQNGIIGVLTKDMADKIPVIMEAVASLENSRLVTTPFTLTNDNTEAEFDIDNQIPYSTSTITGTGLSTSGVGFTDVRTQLTVTPQVNSDDNLTLDVEVQLSAIGANGGPGLPPSTNTRHYKGEVTVPNMKYVVFGGLESEFWDESEQKVPYVGDIPVMGMLFKKKTWTHTRSKIYIFLRPTIFRDDRGLAGFSGDAHERIHVEAQRDEWIPPICSDKWVDAARSRKTLADDVFDTFGPGSGNPFTSLPRED